jgi:hypothetical protein
MNNNSNTGMESKVAAKVAVKEVPASVTGYLSQIQAAKDERNKAIIFTPAFAEYNELVRKGKREEAVAKIDNKFTDRLATIYDSVQVRIKSLSVDIRRKKYPLGATATLVDMSTRILGATEYGTAVSLVSLAGDRFPVEEMWDAYTSNRIDLCSAIIDVASRGKNQGVLTPTEFLNKRVEFSKEVNKVYKLLGVLDLMLEQLQLEKVLTQAVYEHNAAITNPQDTLFAAVEMHMSNTKSDQEIVLLTA